MIVLSFVLLAFDIDVVSQCQGGLILVARIRIYVDDCIEVLWCGKAKDIQPDTEQLLTIDTSRSNR